MYNELDSIYESLYEYYINDYIIFEGILKRDYMECIGVLNEDGDKNLLQKICENILKALEWIRDKIKKIIDKIFKRNKKTNQDFNITNEIYKEYYKLYNKYSDKLNDFKMEWKMRKGNKIMSDLMKGGPYTNIIIICSNMYSMDIDNINIGSIYKVLNMNMDIKEMDEKYKKIYYLDKNIEYPFRNNHCGWLDMENIIENEDEDILFKDEKSRLDKLDSKLKDTEKKVEQKIKELESNIELNKDEIEGKIQIYQLYLKGLTKATNILISDINIKRKYRNEYKKECIKLFKYSYKYLKKIDGESSNESYISDDYINALSEATIYELDL